MRRRCVGDASLAHTFCATSPASAAASGFFVLRVNESERAIWPRVTSEACSTAAGGIGGFGATGSAAPPLLAPPEWTSFHNCSNCHSGRDSTVSRTVHASLQGQSIHERGQRRQGDTRLTASAACALRGVCGAWHASITSSTSSEPLPSESTKATMASTSPVPRGDPTEPNPKSCLSSWTDTEPEPSASKTLNTSRAVIEAVTCVAGCEKSEVKTLRILEAVVRFEKLPLPSPCLFSGFASRFAFSLWPA